MRLSKLMTFLTISYTFLSSLCSYAFSVESPDKAVRAEVGVKNGALVVSGDYKDKKIWLPSAIGLTVDGTDLFENVSLKVKNRSSIDETYNLVSSPAPLRNLAEEVTLTAVHRPSGYKYEIDLRCYNNGIAYRLRLPGSGKRHIDKEVAEWSLPEKGIAWFGERNSSWKLMTYAGEYTGAPVSQLHEISSQGSIQMMPLMCVTPDSLYLTIMEAALTNYSGMRLEAGKGGVLRANFTEPAGFDVIGDILTPWRVMMVNETLDGVVNNHLLTDLAPAPDESLFADRSWIKPGRSVWSWWSNIDGKFMTEDGEKRVIDRAANLGFEFTTLDEGWEAKKDKWEFVRNIVDYAEKRGVGVYLWRHWKDLNNPEGNYAAMGAFMDTVSSLGVKGLKIDYMNGEDKNRIDFMARALQLAAERKLMINFHGCQKPSGEARTWPNEITREAVRGLELNRITSDYIARMEEKGTPVNPAPHVVGGENQYIPACHDVLLPIVRGSIGATDYTPIGLSIPGYTTPAHHLAMAVLLESPLMTMAENPFYLFRNSDLKSIVSMIGGLPVIWDERHVLPQTKLGNSLVMAKRNGEEWYIAGVTTNSEPIKINLDFLTAGRQYLAQWITDGESVSDFKDGKGKLTSDDVYQVDMAENGGFLLKLTPHDIIPVETYLWENQTPELDITETHTEYMDRNGHVWNVSEPTLTVYPAANDNNTGLGVIICPGGGYAFGSFLKEGVWFAEWLAKNGITSGVLKYRMPHGISGVPAEDAARAFEIMKNRAGEFGVNPEKIGVMGFSAGGHLAATMTVHGKEAARPAFSALIYPVITMDSSLTHQGSRKSLLGDNASEEQVEYYSTETQISSDTPPTLLMASYDDKTVNVKNSMLFFDNLKKNGVEAAMYIFPYGGHGWGFKKDFGYHESMKELLLDWILRQSSINHTSPISK